MFGYIRRLLLFIFHKNSFSYLYSIISRKICQAQCDISHNFRICAGMLLTKYVRCVYTDFEAML